MHKEDCTITCGENDFKIRPSNSDGRNHCWQCSQLKCSSWQRLPQSWAHTRRATKILSPTAQRARRQFLLSWSVIGLASATSQLDRNAWQRVATYKSGSKQTWRRIFFVWNHIEKAQTDRTQAQLPLCWAATARFFLSFFFRFRFRAIF